MTNECLNNKLKNDLLVKIIPHLRSSIEINIDKWKRYLVEIPEGKYARDSTNLIAEHEIKIKEINRINKEISGIPECK